MRTLNLFLSISNEEIKARLSLKTQGDRSHLLFYILTLFLCFNFSSCVSDKQNPNPKLLVQLAPDSLSVNGKWALNYYYELEGFNSVGISRWNQYTIISDSTLDVLYTIDTRAKQIFDSTRVSSPVYITQSQSRCLIPSYDMDSIYVYRGNGNYPLVAFTEMDGPTAAQAYSIEHYVMLDQKKPSNSIQEKSRRKINWKPWI